MKHEVDAALESVEKNLSEVVVGIRHALAAIQGRLTNLENIIAQTQTVAITAAETPIIPVTNTAPVESGPKRECDIVPGDGGFVAPVTPVTETPATTPAAETATGELDDEGVPWNADFHASSKSQVNSINVPNGKAWRLKRGVDKDAAAEYKKQFTPAGEVTGTLDNTPGVVSNTPGVVPGAVTPATVPGGVPGVTPAAPAVSENDKVRKEIITLIKQLADEFGFSYDDAKTIFEEEFKVAQNGEGVIFGGVKNQDYPLIKQYFTDLYAAYKNLNDKIVQIYGWAGSEHAAIVDQNKPAAMQNGVGGVYYQDMVDVTNQLDALHQQWLQWAQQEGKA